MKDFVLRRNHWVKLAIVIVLLLSFVISLSSSGCKAGTSKENLSEETTPAVATITSTSPAQVETGPIEEPLVEPSPGKLSFSATPDIEDLEDSNWISPGKVEVGNLYPGATAEYPLTVHNGGEVATEFSLCVRQPDNTTVGYDPFPKIYFDWVVIDKPLLDLDAKQTADVLIIIKMPEDADYSGKQVEFWISVIDQGQSGMVRTELACRWLVSTK